MTTELSGDKRAATILARLDRLPGTRHVWMLITLLSLGGMFEFYDLFMTAYIAPGLVRSGLFVAKPPSAAAVANLDRVIVFPRGTDGEA